MKELNMSDDSAVEDKGHVAVFLSVASEPGTASVDLPMPAAQAIRRALLSSHSQVERMREALTACGRQFEFYAREHAVKADRALSAGKLDEAQASSEKAQVNAGFAARARAALTTKEEK